MPLYEIVLRYADRDEIRLTDRDPRGDGPLSINGEKWIIVAARNGQSRRIARRYFAKRSYE